MSETAIAITEQETPNADTQDSDETGSDSAASTGLEERRTIVEGKTPQWSIQSLVAMLGFLLVVGVLAGYSLLVNLGSSALDPPLYSQYVSYVQPLFPQGWAFFTRSSRETEYGLILLDKEGGLASEQFVPTRRTEFIFGLDRSGRMFSFDLAPVTQELNEDDWIDCDGPMSSDCVEAASANPTFSVSVATAVVRCGTIAVVRREPYPWAYAHKGFDPNRVHDSVQVGEVVCGA